MPESSPRPRPRWRPWKVLLATFVVLALLFFAYPWYRSWQNDKHLQAAIAATDKLDPHWRLADLEAEYRKLPVSKHFGPRLLVWRGYMGWFGDDIAYRPGAISFDREGKHYNVRFPQPYLKILKERLAETEATNLKTIREELAGLMTEPSPSQVPYADMNLMQRVRAVANYLLDEMELAAHEGRYQDLVPLLAKQFRLVEYCQASPNLINKLIGNAIAAVSLGGIKRALALGIIPQETLLQLQQLLSAHTQSNLISTLVVIRAEEFDRLERAQHDEKMRKEIRDQLSMTVVPSKGPTSIWDKPRYYWRVFQAEAEMYDLPLAQALVLELMNDAIEKARTQPEDVPSFLKARIEQLTGTLPRYTCGVSQKLATAELTTQAELRSLVGALACERYRLVTGGWPKSLSELIPTYIKEIPSDPFANGPILYKQLTQGIVVYSVYTNGVNDGGQVLYLNGVIPLDRGTKLFNPELRGKKYEDLKEDVKQ